MEGKDGQVRVTWVTLKESRAILTFPLNDQK